VQLRAALPFEPLVSTTSPASPFRMSPTALRQDRPVGHVLFDLVVFEELGVAGAGPYAVPDRHGRRARCRAVAIGPPSASPPGGPAAVGLFNQNLFAFAGNDDREDVNLSILQPSSTSRCGQMVRWRVRDERDLRLDAGAWVNLPLGMKVAKLVKFGDLPCNSAAATNTTSRTTRCAGVGRQLFREVLVSL